MRAGDPPSSSPARLGRRGEVPPGRGGARGGEAATDERAVRAVRPRRPAPSLFGRSPRRFSRTSGSPDQTTCPTSPRSVRFSPGWSRNGVTRAPRPGRLDPPPRRSHPAAAPGGGWGPEHPAGARGPALGRPRDGLYRRVPRRQPRIRARGLPGHAPPGGSEPDAADGPVPRGPPERLRHRAATADRRRG